MIYLESFQPYCEDRHVYPYKVIYPMGLEQIEFAPITILYGNNGSGKSTLLNVIANRIGIRIYTQAVRNVSFMHLFCICQMERVMLPTEMY